MGTWQSIHLFRACQRTDFLNLDNDKVTEVTLGWLCDPMLNHVILVW